MALCIRKERGMKNRTKFISLYIAFSIILFCSPGFTDSHSEEEVLVKGNSTFAINLYQKLSSSKGNIFFSPYSISSALGMTYAGARGNTEKEIS